ncbi:hypothetical protein VOLCADRAFT_99454 [Volvox carteri f. nagariensis]|uniref:Uncharacterized protein n=1 Tax=Volvox carteri f. nagariensis TaxID=3068 RepID=D8UHU6_VOLCA|nr:uncharacterized protein VOLCADRAFT_99454 [Volvox carteri f. nagariensis]EFJ40681.1 hypothetical protein VOLCADRAFT_99454 [Volvox carteri f. nagariensis]|eukprot:XP_002958227.1 hypothetical protein VOLCADRAFT_99454 [Volvox carteri f. nagariensis]
MEPEVPSPPSPRSDDHNGWTLVERPNADGVTESFETRPRAASPGPEHAAEALGEQEDLQDGLKSPALAAAPSGPTVEEPATPTGASGPHAGSCGDLSCPHLHGQDLDHFHSLADHTAVAGCCVGACGNGGGGSSGWNFDRHHHERLRAVSRLSGEGALEGFQDPQDLLFADSAAPGAAARSPSSFRIHLGMTSIRSFPICSGPFQIGGGTATDLYAEGDAGGSGGAAGAGGTVSLGWDALLSNVWVDLLRELEDVRALVTMTAAALWERVQEGRLAVADWAAAARESAQKTAKSMGRPGCPLWTLIGISGLAAMALAALATQVVVNRRLASQLRQRDKDLARLVVKILNLQDALQSASRAVPVLRTSSLERFATTTTLIGMV